MDLTVLVVFIWLNCLSHRGGLPAVVAGVEEQTEAIARQLPVAVLAECMEEALVVKVLQPTTLDLAVAVQCVLSGAQGAPFHLLTRGMCDAFIYSFTKWCPV
jgi:hypothetical protein